MTSRERTGLLSLDRPAPQRPLAEKLRTVAWGAIQWPWLARSLWGGRLRDKHALLDRLGLPHDALPHLGSWKADTAFLWHLVRVIERLRPELVVELGCGASSLIIARALALNGEGRLISYDQHGEFAMATGEWLAGHGLAAELREAPIVSDPSRWSSCWYDIPAGAEPIGLLVIDGPPWTLNPTIRGRAEKLFDRIVPGGMVLLDDAARPGERLVARRWRRSWPDFRFTFLPGTKGTLLGGTAALMVRPVSLAALLPAALATACVSTPVLAPAPGMAPDKLLVVVDKSDRELVVLAGSRVLARYAGLQFGAHRQGHKNFEGDKRTPEGRYTIDYRNPRSAYHLSLHISYPDDADRAFARAHGRSPGGDIFVHGQPNAMAAGRMPGDWTDGCIALANAEIVELWHLVPDGTPIDIVP